MSILSDAWNRKITWTQAGSEIVSWFEHVIPQATAAAQPELTQAMSDLKQAASNALGWADTALGPIMATGTAVVEGAANVALISVVGPTAAGAITPGLDAAISAVSAGLKAAIDAEEAALRAKLTLPLPPT